MSIRRETEKLVREEYFATIGDREIESQRCGAEVKPWHFSPTFVFPERTVLASLMCNIVDVNATPNDVLEE